MQEIMQKLKDMQECYWLNPHLSNDVPSALHSKGITPEDIEDARARLNRFATLLKILFQETRATNGIIESPLCCINDFRDALNAQISGDVYIKLDSHLPISGSIKARGGIYEVLWYAEKLLLEQGRLRVDEDYAKILEHREFLGKYKIAVGSTGNLGLSIGIMSSKLGFKVEVHMSNDAKEWKKAMLKSHGCNVITYDSDYGRAVEEGRRSAESDEFCYFIDDENSKNLFLGYSVAGKRLKAQLESLDIIISDERPLYVYLPCGVGGGPGGVAYGLKSVFGANVKCFFAEPTHSPCMFLGLLSGKHDAISVSDIGLDNKTAADGLAVGRASKLVGHVMENLIDGCFSISDSNMYKFLALMAKSEDIKLEPSALAGVNGLIFSKNLGNTHKNAIHLLWATGGNMVPDSQMREYIKEGERYLLVCGGD